MSIFQTYGRVLAEIGRDRVIMALLIAGNLAAAGLQFLDPLLFGRVIALLGQSDMLGHDA